jgi:uncharacterized membrane protein YvbJ
MRYCDFCGEHVSDNARYCRHCGRTLEGRLEDTQPFPAVFASSADMTKGAVKFNFPFWKNAKAYRTRLYPLCYYLSSVAILVALIYVLVTFKTLDDYQLLTAAIGVLLAGYFWRKAKQ